MKELIAEIGSLAEKLSAGWHEGLEIDASDIMLMNKTATALEQQAAEIAALQAKLSAMEKQEPIGCGYVVKWETGDTASTYKSGYAQVLGVDVYAAPKVASVEALEALFTNIDHAISSGAWRVQEGSQTWETIHEAKSAIGGQQP